MRNVTVRKFWMLAFLMAGFVAGCGREQAVALVPMITVTVPANGATGVPISQVITATFNKAMNGTTLTTSTFTVTGPGGAAVTGTVTYSGTTATFTPTAALAPNTLYTATITTGAKDSSGTALTSNSVWSFTTAPVPAVISANPLNGATNVPINQKITATFNQAMTSATVVAAGTFTVKVTAGGVAVPGTVTYISATNTATFAPTAALLPGTQYTATMSTAAQSVAGSFLPSNFIWSFTTGLTADVTPPTVISTNPASAATGVSTNQTITAAFSEAMDSATVTAAGTFAVTVTAGGAAVPGTVSYSGTTATFTPTANLTANTQYTATITAAAKDLSGNALIAGAVPDPWSFTTGAGPNVTAPTITLTSPANAFSPVLLNATVNATFSAAMNPVTITAPGTFTVAVSGVGGAAVAGNITYNSVTRIATFTPAANLTATTQYTATITNVAKDLSGLALVAGTKANPWTFTTGAVAGQPPIDLGAASTFGAFGGSAGITNQGTNTIINGDIGTTGVSTLVTGFHDTTVPYIQFSGGCIYTETTLNVGRVNGTIYTAPPPPTTLSCPNEGTASTFTTAQAALLSAQNAYNTLAGLPSTGDPGANLGGLTLAPGVWKTAGGSLLLTGSDLTLDAGGNTNAVFVFQMPASTLTVGAAGAPRSVILINGAQASNVFWQVGSSATINAAGGGTMVGTIIASAGVSFSTAGNAAISTLNGRAVSLTASVTMVNTVVNVPAP